MAILTHGMPEIRMADSKFSPEVQAYFREVRSMRIIMGNKAFSEMLSTAWPSLKPLTCISCGAKTDAHGALPCGH